MSLRWIAVIIVVVCVPFGAGVAWLFWTVLRLGEAHAEAVRTWRASRSHSSGPSGYAWPLPEDRP